MAVLSDALHNVQCQEPFLAAVFMSINLFLFKSPCAYALCLNNITVIARTKVRRN